MPEEYRKYHRHPGQKVRTLQHAADDGQIISVRCNLCRKVVHYLATDLVLVLNPARPVDTPPFACSRCGTADYVDVKIKTASTADYCHLVIRRLLRMRKVPEWGNRPLGNDVKQNEKSKRC